MPESKFNIDDLSKEYKSKISKMDIQPLPQPSPSTQVSPIESAIRGGAQGLTMGLSSRGEALLRNLAGKTPFLPEKSYEQALQESRQAYKQAQEANPIIYTGSEIAGGVLPALIPGTQPATLGRMVALGAGLGAVGGYGYSEAETLPELAKDIATGGALGGILPGIGRGITKGIQALKPATDISIKSGLSAMTGKTMPYLEKVESQPERIKKIERIFTGTGKEETQKLANDISDLVSKNPFGRKAELLSNRAYKVLEKENENISIPKENILNNLKNVANELSKSSSDIDKTTLKSITNKINTIDEKYPNMLNGLESKKLIKEIDKDIKGLTPKVGDQRQLPIDAENNLNILKDIRRQVDVPLKNQSPRYAKAMEPVADATNVSEYLQKLTVSQYGGKQASAKKAEEFINQKLRQNSLTPLETESRTLKLMQEELKKPRYNNYSGIEKLRDVNQTISDLKLLQEIQATGAIGSNITNRLMATGGTTGATIGGMIGGIPGAGIGSSIGTIGGALLAPTMERQGGQIASRVLRATQPIRTGTISPRITQPIERGITRTGLTAGLDQYLQGIAQERNRQKQAESRYGQLNPNRVEK